MLWRCQEDRKRKQDVILGDLTGAGRLLYGKLRLEGGSQEELHVQWNDGEGISREEVYVSI